MSHLIHCRQTRIVGQQIVEDSFNELKQGVDLGTNSRCCNDRACAIPIDRSVFTGVHRYQEVEASKVRCARSAEIEAGWCETFAFGALRYQRRQIDDKWWSGML